MRAVVMGGSGLVGSRLLGELAQRPGWTVTAVARRKHGVPAGVHLRVVDAAAGLQVPPCDVAFCAQGTTIAKAGSQDAFRAVDHGLVVQFAHDAKAMGATQFHVVSALGADPSSRIFYNRVKGEMERDVRAAGLAAACAYRPSLLAGDRAERRRGERFGLALARVARPVLPVRWRAIDAATVARAMVRHAAGEAGDAPSGWHVHLSDEVARMGAPRGAEGAPPRGGRSTAEGA